MDKIQRMFGTAMYRAAIDVARKEYGYFEYDDDAVIEGLAVIMRMDGAKMQKTLIDALRADNKPFRPVADWQVSMARVYADAANLYDRINEQVESFGDAEYNYALDRFGDAWYDENTAAADHIPGMNDECDAGLMCWCRDKAWECAKQGYTTNALYIGDVITDVLQW